MADVICPQCRKPNPDDRAECQFCGARLRSVTEPLPPIRPGEQPRKKNTSELERALPEWLRSARKASDGSEPQHATSLDGRDVPPPRPKEELPNWLAGLEAEKSAGDEEVPDWLSGLQGGASAPRPAEPAEETPDWLRGLQSAQPEPPVRSAPTEPARVVRPAAPPPAAQTPVSPPPVQSAAPPPAADDLPAWLRGEAPASADRADSLPASTPVRTTPAAHERLPDWLAEKVNASDSEDHQIPLPGETKSAGSDEGLPDWLSRLGSAPAAEEVRPGEFERPRSAPPVAAFEKAAPEAAPEPPAPGEMPDWLKSLAAESPGGPPPLTGTPALIMDEPIDGGQDVNAIFSMDMPEWLSSVGAADKPKPAATEPFTTPAPAEDLAPAELPSWVQAMRPVEAALSGGIAPEAESGEQEQAGPLAGLRGVLPGVPSLGPIQQPRAYPNKLQVSDSQQSHAALLEHLLESETRPRPITLAGGSRSQRVLRWAIALLLLLVTALPILGGTQFTPIMARGLFPPETSGALTIVNALPDGAPVLLVFDYDPALSGEMEAAAGPLVDHLMLRGARLTLLSTSPAGPALAERLIAAQAHDYRAGEQFVNLGYLAGGPAAVLGFALDPALMAGETVDGAPAWDLPPLRDVRALADFQAIVVLTDSADTGQVWIEQTQLARGGRPLLLAVSAQAEPMLRPYFDSGQVQGMLTGLMGGASYGTITGRPGVARLYWDSFSLGLILAVILILAGALVSLALNWRNRHGEEQP